MQLDCAYPGGNILVEKIEGDTAFLRQDVRDTEGDWFYWNFRVRGAAGRTIHFHFTGSSVSVESDDDSDSATRPRSGVNFSALLRRFQTTCCMRP